MMDVAVLVIRLLLAMVFGVAGVAKLADRDGAQQVLKDFGVPSVLAPAFALLLSLTELAIAAALLPVATAWWGAVGACALLLLFIAGLSAALARGNRPDCHCFGQLSSAPIGWSTLGRNIVLAVAAALVVWRGREAVGPSVISWMVDLSPAQAIGVTIGVCALGLLVLEGWLLIHLLRQNGRLLLRIEALEARPAHRSIALVSDQKSAAQSPPGLPVGAPAPEFSLATLGGDLLTLETLRASGKPVMLVFSDPGCGPCTALMPEVAQWQREHVDRLTIALLRRGNPEPDRANGIENGLSHILLEGDREIAEAYQVYGTPSAVMVRADGTIGSPVAAGPAAIRELLAEALGRPVPGSSIRVRSFEQRARARQFTAVFVGGVALAAGAAAANAAADAVPYSEVHVEVSKQTAQTLSSVSGIGRAERRGRPRRLSRQCSREVQAEIATLCEGSFVGLDDQRSGAEALVCMPAPEDWNGDLILFARGTTTFPENDCKLAGITGHLDLGSASLPRLANQLGFGFATSSCSEDVLAVRECKEDLVELAANFQDHLDVLASQNNGVNYAPFIGRIFLVGASIGGLVATQLIEDEAGLTLFATQGTRDEFAGAVAACGPIGSFEKLVRYQGDLLVLVDCLYREELADELDARGVVRDGFLHALDGLVHVGGQQKPVVPKRVLDALDEDFCRALEAVIDAGPDKAAKLLRVMSASEPVASEPSGAHTIGEVIADVLCSDILPAIPLFEDRFGGNPYDNLESFYFDPQASLVENEELNQCVDRFAADADTADFETSGQPTEPLVTLHTLLDPKVPFSQNVLYTIKVLFSEQQASYSRVPSFNFGHCAFNEEEAAAAFAVLFFQVAGFELPGVEAVFEDPEALARFHELVGQFLVE